MRPPDDPPTDSSGTLDTVLESVLDFLLSFVVFPSTSEAHAVTLFAAVTWVYEVFDVAPYLLVVGPEKRTGKTRLLEVLDLVVRQPISTASITEAALFRVIDAQTPTMLIDEADALFGKPREAIQGLRAVIDGGHRKGAKIFRMAGPRGEKIQEFSPFCPKVLSGIGEFAPDTVADRSITIRLQRKAADEHVERFRRRIVVPHADILRSVLEQALSVHAVDLGSAWPELPDALNDRAQDVWEPLFAVADLAAGPWPQRARAAALALSTDSVAADSSLGVQLLGDIRSVWLEGADKLFTADLLEQLRRVDESPWDEWNLAGYRLAKMLKPYGVKSRKVRIGSDTKQGWRYSDLEPLFVRYLADSSRNTGTTPVSQGLPPHSERNTPNDPKRPEPLQRKGCSDVPLETTEKAEPDAMPDPDVVTAQFEATDVTGTPEAQPKPGDMIVGEITMNEGAHK